jgi:predicted nucleic-acid-binding Zn-ribbon protein
MDMTRPAPPCPECGGARYWYGSVEFWVGGTSHSGSDQLNAAVCGNCGYSSLYLQNMPGFRQALATMDAAPSDGDPGDAPGTRAAGLPDRSEIRAFRKAVRKHRKSGSA